MADFKVLPTVNSVAVSLNGHTHAAEVDHAALDNLDYASAGHTEFAGTEVENVFLEQQEIRATSAAPVLDAELLTNPNFDTNLTGWTAGTGWSHSSGTAVHTGATGDLSQAVSLTDTERYYIVIDLSSFTSGALDVIVDGFAPLIQLATPGVFEIVFVANATTSFTLRLSPNGSFDGAITSVSLRNILSGIPAPLRITNPDGSDGTEIRAGGAGLLNLFIGLEAGSVTTEGTDNVALGHQALRDNLASRNVAIGSFALRRNTLGEGNLAIGELALTANLSGSNNIAIGKQSLAANLSGSNSVGLGDDTLQANTIGQGNLAIGTGALEGNEDGNENIAIGASSLGSNASGSFNVALGRFAGGSNDGDNSIFIGSFAGANDLDSNRLHIGNNEDLSLIYGVMDSLAANQVVQFNAATVVLPDLPTADPSISDALWNDAGTVVFSGQSAAERAQDAVGTILTDSATIDFTYNDGGPSITAAVIDDSISDAKLRNSGALSVIGRSANSTGDPADISAAGDGEVLRRSGTTLGFGTVATAGLADDAVTYAKIQNVSATDRLLGRDTAAAGDIEEIALGASLEFSGSGSIQRAALTGDVTAAANNNATTIANDAVSNAKLADMATKTYKGRTSALTGDPEDVAAATVAADIQASVDHGSIAGLADDDHAQYLLASGARALSADWDTGEDRSINIERLEARDVEGLRIEDDGGNLGIFIEDGGQVGVNNAAPTAPLHVGAGTDAPTVASALVYATAAGTSSIVTRDSTNDVEVFMLAESSGGVVGTVTNHGLVLRTNNAAVITIGADGTIAIKAGTSTGNEAKVGGTLFVSTTQQGNVGAGEDDLASYSVPANTLAVNGDSIWFEACGTTANNSNVKQLRARFGTAGINNILSQALTVSVAGKWIIQGRVIRTGSATQKGYTSLNGNLNHADVVTTLNQTLSGAITLKVTGEATANNDIVLESFIVGFHPANT